jgi:hypothetical protein
MLFGGLVAWLYCIGEGLGLSAFMAGFYLLMVFMPAMLLRSTIAVVIDWIRKGRIPFEPVAVGNWLVLPLVAILAYSQAKSVSSLKVFIHSANLLAASDKLPNGVHGKLSGFKNTDAPFVKVKGIPVQGIKKTKDAEVFVTAVDAKGITYAYVCVPDGNAPKPGKDQVVRRLWSHWWRLEPKAPARF